MDGLVTSPEAATLKLAAQQPAPGMPPQARVAMPAQRLDRFDEASRRAFVDPERSRSRPWRRIVVLGGALALTGLAISEMALTLSVPSPFSVQALVLVLFSLNFGWIALAFANAIAGTVVTIGRTMRKKSRRGIPIAGRTAVLMPVYNESPEHILAAVEAMARGVGELGEGHAFDWFILSDTTDPEMALAEESAFLGLRARLGDDARVYYRRRRRNTHRKAGNIADFCERWGGAYDYLLTLDADSLIEPETIVELARRIDADPDAGIIQTVPRLINGRSLLARLQQFAGRVYGPVIASGLAWWCQSEGNYWGHNAIIRRKAFTEAAGLPVLSGKPPFGGHILSHDFVEAALIRRAGWTVRIAADLGGSYEEGPQSIVDLAIRDRRWCQGNLQHARIVFARGLHWVSRFHLLNGIASYASSLLWLLLIAAGLALSLEAEYIRPEYFSDPNQMFPSWPVVDPERALRLFALTGVVLFGPKLMGFVALLLDRPARRAAGGAWRILVSVLLEIVVSALIAPISMLIQSRVILSILFGHDAGWKPQRRSDGSITIREAFRFSGWHMGAGLALSAAAYAVSPDALAWLGPAIAGMLVAAPATSLTASSRIGRFARRAGLLSTPEERTAPVIARAALATRLPHRVAVAATPDLPGFIRDASRRRLHLALVDQPRERPRGQIDPVEAMAAAKIGEARSLDEALSYLGPEETAVTLASPALVERLGALPLEQTAA